MRPSPSPDLPATESSRTRRRATGVLLVLTGVLLHAATSAAAPARAAPGQSDEQRATIAVLGHADFVPDATAWRTGGTVGLPDVLASRIIEHLTNSRRFTPVERTALRRVIQEQRFGQDLAATYLDRTLDKAISDMEDVRGGTVAATGVLSAYNDMLKDFQDLGGALGATYLVLGNLEKVDRTSTETAVPFSDAGRTVTTNAVDGRLQIRVIDVATGTVIGASSIRSRMSEQVFEGRQSDTDQYSFYDQLGREAASLVLDVTYPAQIVNLAPMVVSRGTIDGVSVGDVFQVKRTGDAIRDASGQTIGKLQSGVGSVIVTDAQDTVSVVRVQSGEGLKVGDLAIREAAATASSAVASASAVPLGARSASSGLPRLAVGLVKSGSTARTGEGAAEHVSLFTDTIISQLSQTRRFQLIDRQEVDQLLDEQLAQALAENRDMPSAMGTLAGADYLAYGNLDDSSFLSETKTTQLPNSNRTFTSTVWYASGNMRIVDARSGDIMESRKIRVEKTPPPSTDRNRAITLLADAYAEQVVLLLMNAIYPIKVAAITPDGTVYVNRGADGGLADGETLAAFRPGAPIVDPDTGVQLGVAETALGDVVLTEVEDARSKATAPGVSLQVGDLLKRAPQNRGRRASEAARAAANTVTRSGQQLAGTTDKSQGRDDRFTLAVGVLRLNPNARTTSISTGHVKRMTDDLVVKLSNTNRFRVLERHEVDQVLDEKTFEAVASGGGMDARMRELIGADYLIHGEIANFYTDTRRTEVAYLGETETNVTAVAEGTFRMVDVHTGAVVGADKVAFTEKLSNVTDMTQVTSRLMDRFTTDSVAAIVERLFPIKVLGSMADGTVYVNRGQDAGLESGARFDVMRPGEVLVDPDTGLSFGAAEAQIGALEITVV